MQLYEHQRKCARAGAEILQTYGLVYLAMQVRTGKTLTALSIAWVNRHKQVLFVTRKGAIAGIKADYELMKNDLYKQGVAMFDLYVTNYEQLHNLLKMDFDLVIVDEAHNIGTYPKPSLRAKNLKKICHGLPVILLSGTPSPESYSQLFHQFWISDRGLWGHYKNFYAWARDYVQVFKRYYGGIQFNDYSRANRAKIAAEITPYVITLSQQRAGITQHVEENILMVQCPELLVRLMATLRRDRVVPMGDTAILGDTAVKLMSKFHQLSGGTCIDEDGTAHILSDFKAQYIRERFEGQHIAIFYKFQAEGELLKKVFPQWTDDPQRFHDDRKLTFIRQVVSGREGISLRSADALVMYAIDFSALSYFQSIARIQDIRRDKPALLFWVFTDSPMGFESKVYEAVSRKKDYTLDYFKKQFNI